MGIYCIVNDVITFVVFSLVGQEASLQFPRNFLCLFGLVIKPGTTSKVIFSARGGYKSKGRTSCHDFWRCYCSSMAWISGVVKHFISVLLLDTIPPSRGSSGATKSSSHFCLLMSGVRDMPASEEPKPSQKFIRADAAPPPPHHMSGATKSNQFLTLLLPALCCGFMLYSSITAILDSHGDPSTVFFVVSSLSILSLLYLSMQQFERAVAEKEYAKRDRLKMCIWFLAILLNLLFSYRVTSVLESPIMTVVVWGIAAVTSLIGCYLLFFLPQPSTQNDKEQACRLQGRQAADPEGGRPPTLKDASSTN